MGPTSEDEFRPQPYQEEHMTEPYEPSETDELVEEPHEEPPAAGL
jgi:hypothetical protein